MEGSRAEMLSVPLVPAVWYAGRLWVGRCERGREMRFRLRSIDVLEQPMRETGSLEPETHQERTRLQGP